MGEVLKDFYRLAACPGDVDRLLVYVETVQLRRYMARAAQRYGVDVDRSVVALDPAGMARLPATAVKPIDELVAHHVTARRMTLIEVDDALRLAVYEIDPLETATAAEE